MDRVEDVAALLEEMKQYLSYDPETGDFTWINKRPTSRVSIGQKAGIVTDQGYVQLMFNRTTYRTHRLAWLFTHGKWPDKHIDHIDGNRSNNKLSNLRDVTAQENAFNMTKIKSKSGYMGVSKHKSSWRSRIMLNGVDMCIGIFKTPELASEAYQAAKLKYHIIGDAHAGN